MHLLPPPVFVQPVRATLNGARLRPGNVHSADDWEGVLKPVVVRYKGRKVRLYFRGDAAFASPEMYDYLEAESFLYAIRLPKNQILQESIGHLLTRPVGRPPNHVQRYYASFSYQAGSWNRKRRVVAKVEWHPGELCPRAFAPRIAKALHEAARGPPMDYRDNPQHRVLHHTKWCIFTPASAVLLLRR